MNLKDNTEMTDKISALRPDEFATLQFLSRLAGPRQTFTMLSSKLVSMTNVSQERFRFLTRRLENSGLISRRKANGGVQWTLHAHVPYAPSSNGAKAVIPRCPPRWPPRVRSAAVAQ